jgi:hypothetical protein
MEAIDQWEDKGYTVKIYQDEDPGIGPRDWDNLGTMYCFHNNYILGDKHSMDAEDVRLLAEHHKTISLPLFLYDHSGITMSTTPFSCPWDSGQVGYILVEHEKVLKEYGRKRMSRALREKVRNILQSEVEEYDQYLTGDVYGYVIERDGEHIESCWGFYGARPHDHDDYMRKEIDSMVEHVNGERINELFNQCG